MQTRLTPQDLAGHKVMVVGEAILDEYKHGQVERLSREAPVQVVLNPQSQFRCGGAANAAANIASLGSSVTLVSAAGDDRNGKLLRDCCETAGIKCDFITMPSTNVKQRIFGTGQQLLRIDHMESHADLAAAINEAAIEALPEHDAVLLSDYGHEMLAQAQDIVAAANKRRIPVIVDPRSRDWSRYAGADLIKPSAEEFMPGTDLSDPSLPKLLQEKLQEHGFGAILLTGGRKGMLLGVADEPLLHLPTMAQDVYDVTGAGDTVAAVMALALAAKSTLPQAAELANKAAGFVVGKLGAVSVTPIDLSSPPRGRGGAVITFDSLLERLDPLRDQGKSVVMTNGCFDILHAGHLDTLSAAASLGDLLIVAVNDDESVSALKGPDRPITPLEERMQLLAGLGCVDFAFGFSGSNAAEQVAAIAPDVYVKGGDWEGKEPLEAKAAKDKGGKVIYEGFRRQQSTSAIVDSVRANETGKEAQA